MGYLLSKKSKLFVSKKTANVKALCLAVYMVAKIID